MGHCNELPRWAGFSEFRRNYEFQIRVVSETKSIDSFWKYEDEKSWLCVSCYFLSASFKILYKKIISSKWINKIKIHEYNLWKKIIYLYLPPALFSSSIGLCIRNHRGCLSQRPFVVHVIMSVLSNAPWRLWMSWVLRWDLKTMVPCQNIWVAKLNSGVVLRKGLHINMYSYSTALMMSKYEWKNQEYGQEATTNNQSTSTVLEKNLWILTVKLIACLASCI